MQQHRVHRSTRVMKTAKVIVGNSMGVDESATRRPAARAVAGWPVLFASHVR